MNKPYDDKINKLINETEENVKQYYETRINEIEQANSQKGEEIGVCKVAKTMKDKGADLKTIAEYTGLSESEIGNL